MKFNINIKEFADSLNKLYSVVPTRSTLPILDNILFELEGNELRLLSSDLEIFIRTKVEVNGIENGKVAVPAKKLVDLSRSLLLSDEKIIIREDLDLDTHIFLKNDSNFYNLFKDKFRYDNSKQELIYKGILDSRDKKNLLDEINLDEKYTKGDIKTPEKYSLIEKKYEILKKSIENIYKKSEKKIAELKEKKGFTIEVDNNFRITLKTKNGKYNLSGEQPEDFPVPEEKADLNKIEIGGSVFRKFVSKIIHAVNTDEIRRNMSGILFDIGKSELKFVATDGFRLGKIIKTNFTHDNPTDGKIIVPSKTCQLILRLNNNEDSVIEYDESMIKIKFGDVEIYSKLIDDTFPNYKTVIPLDNNKILIIEKAEFETSLRRALIFADDITKRIKLDIINNSMTIKADNPEIGAEGEEIISCEFRTKDESDINFDEEPFSIAFNAGYLLDCVTHIDTEKINFEFNTPAKASIATPTEQSPDENYMELVMPVRVG